MEETVPLNQLYFMLKNISDGFPLSIEHIEKISHQLPNHADSSFYQTLFSLLYIIDTSEMYQTNQSHLETLAQVLQAISVSLKLSAPNRYFVTGQFDEFSRYCLKDKNSQLAALNMKAYGLFPLSSSDIEHQSIFMRGSKKSSPGNPHWIYSRKALLEWSHFNQDLSKQSRLTVNLLLGNDELLKNVQKDPLNKFWAQLYVVYNSTILNQSIKRGNHKQISPKLITWQTKEISEINFADCQNKLVFKEKLIYYLAMEVLAKISPITRGYSLFQAAYSQFLISVPESMSWQYQLALLLFFTIAKKKGQSHIITQCIDRFKSIIAQSQDQTKVLFLQFYLCPSQLIEYIVSNNLSYYKIPASLEIKQTITSELLMRGRIIAGGLRYLTVRDCAQTIFRNSHLANLQFGIALMDQLREQTQHVCSLLQKSLKKPSLEIQKRFKLFISIWTTYYSIFALQDLQSINSEIETIFVNACFAEDSKDIFITPLQSQDAIFNSLTYYIDRYETSLFKQQLLKKYHLKTMKVMIGLLSQQRITIIENTCSQELRSALFLDGPQDN